jgi:hypothetical protein
MMTFDSIRFMVIGSKQNRNEWTGPMADDTFELLDNYDAIANGDAAAQLGDTGVYSVILYFLSLSTGKEFAVEIEIDSAQLEKGELYEKVLAVWGRMINYESLRFDKAVARSDAMFVLATYKGLDRYVEDLDRQAALLADAA